MWGGAEMMRRAWPGNRHKNFRIRISTILTAWPGICTIATSEWLFAVVAGMAAAAALPSIVGGQVLYAPGRGFRQEPKQICGEALSPSAPLLPPMPA